MKTFGQKLKELRDAKRLTQKEIADELGIKSIVTVGRWERDDNLPDVDTIIQLSKYFNYNLLQHFQMDEGLQQDDQDRLLRILLVMKKQLDRMEEVQRQIVDNTAGLKLS
jgi:transcriptional regulator with XRE-family HTH domain